MATTQIKDGYQGGSDNQLKVNSDGSINVTETGGGGSNASVGPTGSPAPSSATEIGGINPSGNLQGVSIDANGFINVNVSGPVGTPRLIYSENTAVPIGSETTITTYTVGVTSASLERVAASSQNIGLIIVYKNSSPIDKKYVSYTGFNLGFNFNNLHLITGDIITVTATNQGSGTCNVNANIQITEVA